MVTRSLPLNGDSARRLAKGLGWFSHGLGVVQIVAPGKVNSLIGVPDNTRNRALQRLFGMQEIGAGTGILVAPKCHIWVWSRVAGDLVHVTLMTRALGSRKSKRTRVATALTSLVGVTALDAITAASLTAYREPGDVTQHVTYATTIKRPVEEVYRFWRDFGNFPTFMRHLESVEVTSETRSRWKAKAPVGQTVEWEAEIVEDRPNDLISWRSLENADVATTGSVRFRPAPGDRGTELAASMEYAPPAGGIGVAVALLAGEDPRQQLQEDLLRLKNVLEVGEVVISAGTIQGATLLQRHAQPPETPTAS